MGDMDEWRGDVAPSPIGVGIKLRPSILGGMATLRKSVAVHPKIEYQFCLSSYPPNFN